MIEAIVEELGPKQRLFGELDGIVDEGCILATNTSALSVTQIASATARPERVVGLHFFNPAPVLQLVEVVKGEQSSDGTVDAAFAFAQRIGKQPIRARDTPGFVVNRILIPTLIDAVRVLEEGTASAEDIDAGMKLGTGWPIGPLALIDLIGVDVTVHAAEAMAAAYGDQRFSPPATLSRMLEAGQLGRSQVVALLVRSGSMTVSAEIEARRRRHDGERQRAERGRPRPDDRPARRAAARGRRARPGRHPHRCGRARILRRGRHQVHERGGCGRGRGVGQPRARGRPAPRAIRR